MPQDDFREPFLPELDWWVQDRSVWWHVMFMCVGTVAGYIYAVETGSPIKPSMFIGALLGFFFLPIVVMIIQFTLGALIIGAFLAIVYWVFFT